MPLPSFRFRTFKLGYIVGLYYSLMSCHFLAFAEALTASLKWCHFNTIWQIQFRSDTVFSYKNTKHLVGHQSQIFKTTFIVSVLEGDEGYTAKYGVNPQEFPWAAPSGTPLGSSHISPYIPPLLLIRIQYTASKGQRTKLISVDIFGGAFNDYLNPCKTTHDFLVEVNRVCSDRA